MKKYLAASLLCLLLAIQAQAQLGNKGAFVNITPGSSVKALNGIVNADGGTLIVEGSLVTPADLTNTSGATLQGDGQYRIGGDWTNEASFNAGTSTVTFDGDQNSMVSSGGGAFFNLILDKTGGNDLLLFDDMDIENTLDFQTSDNHVVLGDHNLQVLDIVGYDATRYMRTDGTGMLVRNVGNMPVDFPVGNTSYNPATLTNAGTPDFYLLRVTDAVLSGGNTGSPISADAVGRGWFVEENTPGGSDLSLALQWNGADEQATFDRTQAYVSHFLAGSWDTQPTASATGSDPYTLSRTGITSLSPFAVFDGDFSALIDISGIILWEHDEVSGVKNANVALTGDDTDNMLTPLDGTYTLTATNGSNFTVTPTKNINKLNGITTADATRIQQHVANISPITDPYKLVAADVNKSNSVTTQDASIINQCLLGNPAALNQFKTSWRFVPVSHTMSVPPWGFPEKINLTGVSGDLSEQDFWGIKTGDVITPFTDPANFNNPDAPGFALNAPDQSLQFGEQMAVTFSANEFSDLAGLQFALKFDVEKLALAKIEPLAGLPVSEENFGTYNISEGEINVAWSQAEGIHVEEAAPVFKLTFNVLETGGTLSEAIQLADEVLEGHAYTSTLADNKVVLNFFGTTSANHPVAQPKIELLQNRPNPFVGRTTIGFVLSESCEAQLRVFDAAGRELFFQKKNYAAGRHEKTLELEGASGVLWYELTTPFGTQTKRMVRITN